MPVALSSAISAPTERYCLACRSIFSNISTNRKILSCLSLYLQQYQHQQKDIVLPVALSSAISAPTERYCLACRSIFSNISTNRKILSCLSLYLQQYQHQQKDIVLPVALSSAISAPTERYCLACRSIFSNISTNRKILSCLSLYLQQYQHQQKDIVLPVALSSAISAPTE
ncbi:hypothetical protein, partial [Staphylococcus aureus]